MGLPAVSDEYLISFLTNLLNVPSPTGRTCDAIDFIAEELSSISGLEMGLTRKGALLAKWPGEKDSIFRAVTAHTDTLGGMVKEIKSNGRLKITRIGGLVLNGVETEGCTVFTVHGSSYRGSFMFENASVHVHGAMVNETQRTESNMEIRLDERVKNSSDVEGLGIQIGDFVAFDPRVVVSNGFIRSRFLDDKACVANLVSAIRCMDNAGLRPKMTTQFLFSNYEEVGHGAAAGFSNEVGELLAVDMAAVGVGQNSDEYNPTICLKDSGGPYHHGFSTRLRQIAESNGIPYKTDIYPYYRSDGEAALQAGADFQVALIGPGVDASHNYERTHIDALTATTKWVMAYLLSDEA